jgi:transposase
VKPAPLTDRQKREIVRLRRERKSYKEIATTVGVTVNAAEYWVKKACIPTFHATKPPDPYTVRPALCVAQHQAARAALHAEIEAAKAERATAPLFRIRPDEWAPA